MGAGALQYQLAAGKGAVFPDPIGTALDGEAVPAFEPPRLQDTPPGLLSHALAEAVDPVTTTNFRLIGSLYHVITPML